MNKKFNIQLNAYPHCLTYEIQDSVYYDSQDQVYELRQEHPDFEVSEDDFVFDDEAFEKDFNEAFVYEYFKRMPNIVVGHGESEIDKPSEYRCFHRGDYCYVDVILSENWLDVMLEWIEYNQEWFSERIYEEWQSRDGFWSFMDTDVEGWIKHLKEEDERYIGQMLYYMAIAFEDEEESFKDEILCAAYEDVFISSYNHLSEDKKKELYELEHPRGYDMTNQLELEL